MLERDRAQGVFSQSFIEFSRRMINDYRLKNGAANLKKHADTFARAEREFGVPGPVITAFWALETDFGAVQGDFLTLNALVTLAHDCRRPELFRPQVVPLLTLIDRGVLPADVRGAWAGEIGQTQMLPSDYLLRGVDGDGDGIVDLRRSVPDVILTTAKKILSRGWKPGQPWIREVRVPDEMPWEETGRTNKLPLSQWSAWGVTERSGAPLADAGGLTAGLVLPMGRKGPAFLTFDNYDVYLRVEPVGDLHADRRPPRRALRRAAGLRSARPRTRPVARRDEGAAGEARGARLRRRRHRRHPRHNDARGRAQPSRSASASPSTAGRRRRCWRCCSAPRASDSPALAPVPLAVPACPRGSRP